MIRLARASRSDSNTMKAITILTMVFLPATFVCSLFSMGFFDFSQNNSRDSRMHVTEQFWIYFAVTVPLTVVVLGICAAWLQWSGRQGDDFGETPTAVAKRLD
jgi:Mg2+ and Co2+ transporter CorA